MTDLRDTDQALVGHLRTLGDEWGPLGVALVAAQLADPAVVHARLDDLLLGDAPTEPTERWPHDTWPRWPNIPTTGVHAGQRPAPSCVNLVLWLVVILAAGCATGAALALLVR